MKKILLLLVLSLSSVFGQSLIKTSQLPIKTAVTDDKYFVMLDTADATASQRTQRIKWSKFKLNLFNNKTYTFPSSYLAGGYLYDSLGTGVLKWKLAGTPIDTTKIGYLAKNQIWTGLNQWTQDSLKYNGLWYDYPASGRIAGSVLYDSLGDGVYKFRKMQPYILTTYPVDRNGDSVVVRYNATNLKLTANRLNTIQDINTTASNFTIGGLTVNGNSNTQSIYPLLTDTYDLGSFTKYWSNAYMSQIQATIFAENTISAIGGYLYITKGQGVLPAIASGTTQIDFGQTMTVSDIVLIKAKNTSGTYNTEYIGVASLVGGTTYNVTRDLASAHPTDPAWADGTVYVILGQNGNGRLELNAYDTPRLSIIKQGAAYNSQTELIRLGDLNGFLGYSSEIYGIGIGEATKYLKYDPVGGLVVLGDINATSGKFGTSTNYWSVGATGLTAISSSTDVFINYGKTDFGQDATNGFMLGYDYSASKPKFEIGSSASKIFKYDGTDLSLIGGTITGGTIQTATSGQRVELTSTNGLRFYDTGSNYSSLSQDVSTGLTTSGNFTINGGLGVTGNISGNTISSTTYTIAQTLLYGRTGLNIGDPSFTGFWNFNVNSSGQITKVNNTTATSGYYLRGDGTSFTPAVIAAADLPSSIDATKTADGSISNTEFQYLNGASSNIQTQINNVTSRYGEMIEADASTTITCDGSTYVKYSGTATGLCSSDITYSAANDELSIDASAAGKYLVNYSVTFTVNTAGDYYWALRIGTTAQNKTKQRITCATSTAYSVSGSAVLTLADSETINIGCFGTNTNIATIIYLNVNITRITN